MLGPGHERESLFRVHFALSSYSKFAALCTPDFNLMLLAASSIAISLIYTPVYSIALLYTSIWTNTVLLKRCL
jgi:hypothetical protein